MRTKPAARGFAVDGRTGKAAAVQMGQLRVQERVKPKGNPKFGPVEFGRKRVVEINRLIAYRYPSGIPEHDDDDDSLWFPIAHALYLGRRTDAEFDAKFTRWIATFMPWAADRAQQFVDKFRSSFNPRADHMTAASVAGYVRTTEVEKRVLRLSTVAIYGMNEAEYSAWLNEERKRKRRERDANKPGKQTREEWRAANSDSREKPWDAKGVSRATWYRGRQARETGPVPHGETGHVAPIESILATTAPVSSVAPVPACRRVKAARKAASVDQLSFIDMLTQGAKK